MLIFVLNYSILLHYKKVKIEGDVPVIAAQANRHQT